MVTGDMRGKSEKFFKPLDGPVIILLAAAAAWGFLAFRLTDGARAVVYVANKKFAWYELTGATRRIPIPTRIGEIVIEIGGGSARVISSPCPNQLCVKTGSVRHNHEEVVCMPAQMLLTLEGGKNGGPKHEGETDVITY